MAQKIEEVLKSEDVLLVVPPLMEIIAPSLGLHLLQASCREAGIETGVLCSNLLYSKLIGEDLHKVIAGDICLLLGERIFAAAAFDIPSVSIGREIHKFSDPAWAPDHIWQVKRCHENQQIPEPVVPFRKWLGNIDLEYLESLTADWLNTLAKQIVNIGFRIVGCSTTFGGFVPAAALLNCIKKADPEVITIIGGVFCETEMAEGITSLNIGIDYIFSGEGELTFPPFVKQILKGRLPAEKIISGETVADLDTLPLPDYQNYREQRKKLFPSWDPGNSMYILPFETSRGCCFGKCRFCGFNGKRNVFRHKSPDSIIQSLKALEEREGMKVLFMTDNMMPSQYFDTLIPRLPAEISSIKIFYMINANLTLDQVISLKHAGIKDILPGIESLSPSLLRRMHKSSTVRENIALLRYARSANIGLNWIILFGFPGDQTREYEEMLQLLPLIRHLQPPMQMFPLRLVRFSKYHTSPEAFGISNLRPAGIYKDIFPSHADLEKITYYFAADFPSQSRENPAIIKALWEEYQVWSNAWAAYETISLEILLPSLHVTSKSNDRYVLEDTRGLPDRPKQMEINRQQASLILVARPLEAATGVDVGWALDAGLGVVIESWFIPLATAEPTLLQKFERDFNQQH
jgi:ribosomal peptide maturation radical SAM protein 1